MMRQTINMDFAMFAVASEVYCVWEYDLSKKTLDFLDGIDHEYFAYVARAHFQNLDSEDRQRASMGLRSAYHHGLETLFLLLCGVIQAPECIHAYVLKCFPKNIREVVETVNNESFHLYNKFGLEYLSWRKLCEIIFAYSNKDSDHIKDTVESFALLWRGFASDYLKNLHIKEYNSIKHGFRARAGGFGISFAKEISPGVLPENPRFFSFGQCEFGTAFLTEELAEGDEPKSNPNFTTREHHLNWDPEAVAHGLNLISMSIFNIISFLKIINGRDPGTVMFSWPQEAKYFEKPFDHNIGVISSSFSPTVNVSQIRKHSKSEIKSILEKNVQRKTN
jgi:hypothetical protein